MRVEDGIGNDKLKVLVIRFSSLGDIILTTPAIRCLKKQLNAEVHYLTKRGFAGILQPNPYIDKLWLIDDQVKEVADSLKKESFTHIVDLHRNIRSTQTKRLFPDAIKITYKKGTWAKLRRIYFKSAPPRIHVVERYLQALNRYGVQNDGEGLDFFIPPESTIKWADVGIEPNQYVAVVVGAAHHTKRLPLVKLLDICNGLTKPVVVLGGKDVQETADELARHSSGKIINLVGLLDFMQSARMVENARGVIAHDTGFMHIAAALHKPLISIWGSTDPDLGFWPYFGATQPAVNFRSEVQNLSCRPCSKFGRSQCPKGHFKCMNDQDVEKILEVAREF